MPKSTLERICFTTTGVIISAYTFALFNKSLVYSFTDWGIFYQALLAFCQKAPVAWILQFFFVQKFAGKMAAKYPTDNQILYTAIRVGFTVLIMCPIMSLVSNVIIVLEGHAQWGQLFFNWIPKMIINWPFAFFVQIFALQPLNKAIFRALFRRKATQASHS